MFFKNRNIISKIKRSKVTDYAALNAIKILAILFLNLQYSTKLEKFAHLLSSADLHSKINCINLFSEIPSECLKGLIQIKLDVVLDQIWVQTVCKGDDIQSL